MKINKHKKETEISGNSNLINSTKKHSQQGWDEAFRQAIADGQKPERDMFDGMKNTFDDSDWTW
jgi:hypothetical protein